MGLYINGNVYLYDKGDKEYVAEVREIREWAEGAKKVVNSEFTAVIVKPKYINGDARFVIRNGQTLPGWDWAPHPVPPIRKGAIVQIENWDRMIECKVLGLVDSALGSAHADSFAFEGIRALRDKDLTHMGSVGRIKGHRFTASTDSVKKIISNGRGRRLLLGPYLTQKEQREIFKDLYS